MRKAFFLSDSEAAKVHIFLFQAVCGVKDDRLKIEMSEWNLVQCGTRGRFERE